jgi:hypothetical protein
MNTPAKIGPILVVAVLGLASLTLLTRAWGETSGAKLTEAAWAGGDAPKHGDRLDTGMQGPGGHGRMWRCNAPGGFGPGGMHHHMGWRNPDMIAKHLNAMETEIGIRTNQLDAWRDFTDALQGVMQRPTPPWQTADAGKGGDAKPQPFALAEGLANNMIARSKSAETLLKSIDALKTKLTPEQLDKVAQMEARFRAHHSGTGPHSDAPSSDDPQPNDSPQHGPDQGDRL